MEPATVTDEELEALLEALLGGEPLGPAPAPAPAPLVHDLAPLRAEEQLRGLTGGEPLGPAPAPAPLVHDLAPLRAEEQLRGLTGGAVVYYRPGFLDREAADGYFGALLPGGAAAVPWERRPIMMFGREVFEKHATAYYGDPGATYKYSGKTHAALPWEADPTGSLADLLGYARAAGGAPYNYCLCNLYDKTDSIGAHSDDERDLVGGSSIFSVSLGRTRRFLLTPKGGAGARGSRISLNLAHGSAVVMAGQTQRAYKHEVPAQTGADRARPGVQFRINLTFRCVRP